MPVVCGVHIRSQSAAQESVTDVCVCVCESERERERESVSVGSMVLVGSCNLCVVVLCCYTSILGKECLCSCLCINGLVFCKPFTIRGSTEIWSYVLHLVILILRHCWLVSEMEF
jgi:hypothetical protein